MARIVYRWMDEGEYGRRERGRKWRRGSINGRGQKGEGGRRGEVRGEEEGEVQVEFTWSKFRARFIFIILLALYQCM